MAETNAATLMDNAEQSAPEAQAENHTPPGVIKMPPWGIPTSETKDVLSTPDSTDKIVVTSNVIDIFGDDHAATQESEKELIEQDSVSQGVPVSEQDNIAQDTPAPEQDTTAQDDPAVDIDKAKQESAETEHGIAEQEAPAAEEKAPDKQPSRRGRPPKTDREDKAPEADKPKKAERSPRLPKGPKEEKASATVSGGGTSGQNVGKDVTPATVPESPAPPRDATRPGETETIVYINHADLHPFKSHPFQVRDDDAMKALVESVKERGIDQPALVRPREDGGYELVAGHRRQYAAELAGYMNVPCVIRNMTDDEAILAMTESNFNQRADILPSERAQALKMQLDAIKRQGARFDGIASGDVGKRSNEVIADRNKMSVKNVQRYIALNNLVPDLLKKVDDKEIKFTTAVDLSYIRPKNQRYIAVAIDAQESAPSGAQAQRMRELDQKGVLNGDVIDGIMIEEKKEETRVILNSQELGKYFGPDKTPREMKDTILKLLDDYAAKQPPEHGKPEKKHEAEK